MSECEAKLHFLQFLDSGDPKTNEAYVDALARFVREMIAEYDVPSLIEDDGRTVCDRLGIDVPKWGAEIRAKVSAAQIPPQSREGAAMEDYTARPSPGEDKGATASPQPGAVTAGETAPSEPSNADVEALARELMPHYYPWSMSDVARFVLRREAERESEWEAELRKLHGEIARLESELSASRVANRAFSEQLEHVGRALRQKESELADAREHAERVETVTLREERALVAKLEHELAAARAPWNDELRHHVRGLVGLAQSAASTTERIEAAVRGVKT